MAFLAEQLRIYAGPSKKLRILCFRGGMRSGSLLWLASLFGISCHKLHGGYKAFRRYCQRVCAESRKWKVIGGFTGSGKSCLLMDLKSQNVSTLDLEEIACHKGSAFGALPNKECPTSQQFENEIAMRLRHIPLENTIFVEDESRLVGPCVIPPSLYQAFNAADLMFLNCSKEERIQRIVDEYGVLSKDLLVSSLLKLQKRIGREKIELIRLAIESGSLEVAVSFLLDYYDSCYTHALKKRARPYHVCTYQEIFSYASNRSSNY